MDSYFGHGILKSTDGGQTWQQLGDSTFEGQHIGQIVVDPTNDQNVYAAADGGVYQSTDGGQTWTAIEQLSNGNGGYLAATDLVMTPGNPNQLYATFFKGGIYEGTYANGTWTWTQLTQGLPTGGFDKIAIAIAPTDPTVYIQRFLTSIQIICSASTPVQMAVQIGHSWRIRPTT